MKRGRLELVTKLAGGLGLYNCDCGKQLTAYRNNVNAGRTKSCGCFQKERKPLNNRQHGFYGTRIYEVWGSMLKRCSNPKTKSWKNYGGRGIKVCEVWKDAGAFCSWALNNGWKPGLQIDRIDNDGNYEPSNCRFVTSAENACNVRRFKHQLPLGAYKNGNRYSAQFKINGVLHRRFGFTTPEDAHRAYLELKRQYSRDR